MAEANGWIGLVEETREALGLLRAGQLEDLARRAQQALDAGSHSQPRTRPPNATSRC
jgi:hypothetical protein